MDSYTNHGSSRRAFIHGATLRPSNVNVSLKPIMNFHGANSQEHRESNDTVIGGGVKNAGYDPRHPRLSRDPNWYSGRGRDKANDFLHGLGEGIDKAIDVGSKIAEVADKIPV